MNARLPSLHLHEGPLDKVVIVQFRLHHVVNGCHVLNA